MRDFWNRFWATLGTALGLVERSIQSADYILETVEEEAKFYRDEALHNNANKRKEWESALKQSEEEA